MKKKTIKFIIVFMLSALLTQTILSGCKGGASNRNVVYEDIITAFERSNLLSANIGLFSKTEKDGAITYVECGSGVIFDKRDGAYYALTAAHVVSTENAKLLVFTTNTELKEENVPGLDGMNPLSQDAYDAMYAAELLYKSTRDDLAVIRFAADEDLKVAETADSDPENGDRIMCIGNPQNDWFAVRNCTGIPR